MKTLIVKYSIMAFPLQVGTLSQKIKWNGNGRLFVGYIKAGFNKIIFIIRQDIEVDFKERIGNRVEKMCNNKGIEVVYCFQSLNEIPKCAIVPEGRIKPWGTGQAVLAAKELIKEPFVVINADDYYGKEAFVKVHDWLAEEHDDNAYSIAGCILKNTLSDNGVYNENLYSDLV